MKKIFVLKCALMFAISVNAQSDRIVNEELSFGEGKSIISIGYGGPNQFKAFINKANIKAFDIDLDQFNIKGAGPFHLKYEYGLNKNLGVGVSLNYANVSGKYTGTNFGFYKDSFDYSAKISSTSVLFRINGHMPIGKYVDPYIGIGVGYKGYSVRLKSTNKDLGEPNVKIPIPFPLGAEFTFGSRFYLTNNIGAYIEAGLAKSLIQGGLAIKF